MAEVRLRGLRKRYGADTQVLKGIDLDIADGEFTVLVGPSGCGKSTLLRLIAGLETLDEGEIHIGGRSVGELDASERGVAMVFQSYALYPHMTVEENMGFALRMAGESKAAVRQRVAQVAEILHIGALLQRRPRELSGGQRQRVAIGRAIVRRPAVFLFDEPLSNLDAALRVQMRLELARLHRELGTTMIYVTHDQVEAMTLGDRLAVFNAGHVEQVGTPLALFERPASRFVAGFLGTPTMNFVPLPADEATAAARLARAGLAWRDGRLMGVGVEGDRSHAGHSPGGSAATVAGAASATSATGAASNTSDAARATATISPPLTLGVRASHVQLCAPDEGLSARVEVVEHLGDVVIAHARLDPDQPALAVRLAAHDPVPQPGECVGLRFHPDHVHVFDAEGRALAA